MFGWFFSKKEVKRVEEDTKRGFEAVKKDITSVSGWIKHLNSERNLQKKEIEEVKEVLSTVQNELEGLKNIVAIMNELKTKGVFRTPKQGFDKQTGVYAVQTGVQTAVQTPNLGQFSVTERAILLILLNSDMKLSYDDLAAMLGKERSTIRGHLNRIKQKGNGLIEEAVEKSGKKRVYIKEEIKDKMLKKAKMRVKSGKRSKNKEK
jgi:DNA-binding CsgD family transcriptional regulator